MAEATAGEKGGAACWRLPILLCSRCNEETGYGVGS